MADTNYKSFANQTGLGIDDLIVDPSIDGKNPADFDDLLKFSAVKNSIVGNFAVRGQGRQRENAIDLNNGCEDILFYGGDIEAGKQSAIVVKGGCRDIRFKNVHISRPGGHSDLCLGEHSDQSFKRTTGTVVENVTREDGGPIRVRLGNADKPQAINCEIKVLFWWSLLTKLNWWRGFLWSKIS